MKTSGRVAVRLAVRGYEMSASAEVSLATLARHLEHVRWEAIRAAGATLGVDLGRGVVRAQRIESRAPAAYPMELEAQGWVARVGRTSMDFGHAIVDGDGRTLAVGSCTIVRLDDQGSPRVIPERVRELVSPCEPVDVPGLDEPAPADAFERAIVVVASDLDVFQHVNHARYIDFADDTRALFDHERGGAATPASTALGKLFIEYRREARMGERIRALGWRPAGSSTGFAVELRAADAVLVRARIEPARA